VSYKTGELVCFFWIVLFSFLLIVGEVAVSANIFESCGDEVVVPLSSHGTCTLLYNAQGETATVTYRGVAHDLPPRHALFFNKGTMGPFPSDSLALTPF
jgi:hypothetical protein